MHRKWVRIFLIGWLLTTVMLSAGCSKITQQNYNQLKIGMSYDEVVGILGEPDQCNSAVGLKDCRWGNEKRYIEIRFAGPKVVFYSAEGLK